MATEGVSARAGQMASVEMGPMAAVLTALQQAGQAQHLPAELSMVARGSTEQQLGGGDKAWASRWTVDQGRALRGCVGSAREEIWTNAVVASPPQTALPGVGNNEGSVRGCQARKSHASGSSTSAWPTTRPFAPPPHAFSLLFPLPFLPSLVRELVLTSPLLPLPSPSPSLLLLLSLELLLAASVPILEAAPLPGSLPGLPQGTAATAQ
ncbi:hypothetical protein HaLaN_13750 [Haematococcus lacustris]|uniref:Uncharacterized protein n=1 Tax=Haematococcus lacustris TaxID=44745 RepID=A0A699Z3J0_HAELA|nr:hypothetical protein HaLaN_13750 [Haematococcus lacustris]